MRPVLYLPYLSQCHSFDYPGPQFEQEHLLQQVVPIIVAAVPIPDDLNADQLLDYGKQILYGLLDKQI
jgi:hypothetical protein